MVSSPRMALAERIDALLPQTQCTRCGYPACKPYAQAIAQGQARINHCPPGGSATITALAKLLGQPPLPLDPAFGEEPTSRIVALIDEAQCIGCTLCIQACPVDAIIGAAKLMHTVLLDECSGCELCLPPCPVDCISLLPATAAPGPAAESWTRAHAERAKLRYQARQQRENQQKRDKKRKLPSRPGKTASDPRKALIADALARVKQRKAVQT